MTLYQHMAVICLYPVQAAGHQGKALLRSPCAPGCSELHSSPPTLCPSEALIKMGLTSGIPDVFSDTCIFLLTQLQASLMVGCSMNCILLLLSFQEWPAPCLTQGSQLERTDWGNRSEMQHLSNFTFSVRFLAFAVVVFLTAFSIILADFHSSAVELKPVGGLF